MLKSVSMKHQRVAVYPHSDLFEKIKKKCVEEDRSFNYIILKILKEYFGMEEKNE